MILVSKTLNDYRKQSNTPGFRAGKTPLSIIKKKYGKGVLAEELNKVVNESLLNFIKTNNLSILGNPLPKENEEVVGDFDNPKDFEFAYEIGLSPKFDIKLSKKNKFDFIKVAIDKEMLDKEIENLTKRYGTLVENDVVEDTNITITDIKNEFGEFISDSVSILTDESGQNSKERKTKTYAKMSKVSGELELALVVKAADRLANVQASYSGKNTRLLKMYKQEHEVFKSSVQRDGLANDIWQEIEKLLAN